FFFFQAEDGIRDFHVTGVQTCALPIWPETRMVFVESLANPGTFVADLEGIGKWCADEGLLYVLDNTLTTPYLCTGKAMGAGLVRSEERRVGKECRSRWPPEEEKKIQRE